MCACVYLAILGGALFISWLPCISVKSSLWRDLIKRDLTIVKLNWGWCLDSHWFAQIREISSPDQGLRCQLIFQLAKELGLRFGRKIRLNFKFNPSFWLANQNLRRRNEFLGGHGQTVCFDRPPKRQVAPQLFRSSLNFRVSWYLCAWNSDICRWLARVIF